MGQGAVLFQESVQVVVGAPDEEDGLHGHGLALRSGVDTSSYPDPRGWAGTVVSKHPCGLQCPKTQAFGYSGERSASASTSSHILSLSSSLSITKRFMLFNRCCYSLSYFVIS